MEFFDRLSPELINVLMTIITAIGGYVAFIVSNYFAQLKRQAKDNELQTQFLEIVEDVTLVLKKDVVDTWKQQNPGQQLPSEIANRVFAQAKQSIIREATERSPDLYHFAQSKTDTAIKAAIEYSVEELKVLFDIPKKATIQPSLN